MNQEASTIAERQPTELDESTLATVTGGFFNAPLPPGPFPVDLDSLKNIKVPAYPHL